MPGTSGPDHMFPSERTTQYQVAIPTDDWDDWKRTVPRDRPLYERIYDLLQLDLALDGDIDPETIRLLLLKAERIQQRTRTARQALAQEDDDTVREELAAIDDLIAQLLE